MDFVPKKSQVAAVLQCGGLWFGGKGWGVTWKVNQCVVKPQEVISVFGKCQIQLSVDDIKAMDNNTEGTTTATDEDYETVPATIQPDVSVTVADSDDDEEEAEEEVKEPEPAPVPKKKVVKKAVVTVVEEPVSAPKKKVVKKKAVVA
jgi:hypothetical protein